MFLYEQVKFIPVKRFALTTPVEPFEYYFLGFMQKFRHHLDVEAHAIILHIVSNNIRDYRAAT